jgi:hypothetical protein
MKIKEILEMTYTVPLATIAKDHLPVSEKPARRILKEIGCVPNKPGKKGWTYAGENAEILEKDFSEFVKKTKRQAKPSNSDNTKVIEYRSLEEVTEDSKRDIIEMIKDKRKEENDSMKSEILSLIKGDKEENERIYKGIYFDKDLARFLDNVQHGNKSEIVNKIMRQYLTDNDLL